jgi:hypothetical protein
VLTAAQFDATQTDLSSGLAEDRSTVVNLCSAPLNSLISGVSRISRSRCQASAETLSAINRSRNVRYQPTSYTSEVGRAGLEPATNGL